MSNRGRKDDVLLFSILLIIYTSHCSCVHVCRYSRLRQSFSDMSFEQDVPIHVRILLKESDKESVWESGGMWSRVSVEVRRAPQFGSRCVRAS